MSDAVQIKDKNMLRRLRSMRVLVIHPDDPERQMFLAHLKRIGCQVDSVWPTPDTLPEKVDVVLFLLSKTNDQNSLNWMASSDAIMRIAIISFETPEILTELERLNVHGVLTKPIRIFGILAVLTTAVGLFRHESRLKQRVNSLDEMLKSRRKIEQAVSILSESKNISEEEAFRRLRDKSQNSQVSITEIANAIIASSDI